ncbi:MAG TPA: hypothetical protein VM938_11995 [Acidimicrobiales bacterium]|nr:hypothetical protein [Acidimicrobiales bacterium]
MSDTDPTGRPADAEPVVPDPEQSTPDAADGWAAPDAPDPVPPPPPPDPVPAPAPPPVVTAEPEPEPEAAPEAAPEAKGSRRLLAACVALFVLSVALAALAAVLASRLESERSRRNDVEEVAGRFATALLTYNHENLDESRERVLALSTGKFREEYEQAFKGGLDVLIKETKATSAGTVTDIFIGPVEDNTAKAIVVANATTEGTTGTRRSVASYIQLVLVHVGGEWRVDGVTNLNFGQGTTPTTTPR